MLAGRSTPCSFARRIHENKTPLPHPPRGRPRRLALRGNLRLVAGAYAVNVTAEKIANFWARVSKSETGGCWEWTGWKDKDGYGRVAFGHCGSEGTFRTHRFTWELANGLIHGGQYVCHKCDNPGCVNPSHMFLGDAKANALDAVKKNRHSQGERNGIAKLTEELVRFIRSSKEPGLSLGPKLGVRQTTISMIRTGQTWKHLLPQT